MPAVAAIPWLIPLITGLTAAGTLAETGYTLAQGSGGSSATSQEAAQQKAAAAQQAAQQKAAFLAAQPNVQANTGGSLASTAFNTAAATQAGVPSDLNSIADYLGKGGGGGGTSSAPISGGITSTNNQSQSNGGDLDSLSNLLRS